MLTASAIQNEEDRDRAIFLKKVEIIECLNAFFFAINDGRISFCQSYSKDSIACCVKYLRKLGFEISTEKDEEKVYEVKATDTLRKTIQTSQDQMILRDKLIADTNLSITISYKHGIAQYNVSA